MKKFLSQVCVDDFASDYFVHSFHSYPCKFPPFLPRQIINNYAKKTDVIFDPFVGSGTTLVEATLLGHSSIGSDINPLSCLLSKVKSQPLSRSDILEINVFLKDLVARYRRSGKVENFTYPSISHWFQENVVRELSFIRESIKKLSSAKVRNFLLIVFSSIIVKVSNQESDTRYASINKKIKDLDTLTLFIKKTEKILSFYDQYASRGKELGKSKVVQLDGRNLISIKDNSVDIIITSPPYANTYDYYLYHKHRKFWLEMDVSYAQKNEIGSRREFSSIKEESSKWFEDLKKVFLEMKRVTKKKGLIFIVIGDSVINKKIIKMDEEIKKICKAVGLTVEDCYSYPLAKNSKVFNPNFTSKNKKNEHIMLLKK